MTDRISDIDSGSAAYVEGLMEEFRRDRSRVSPEWREYFEHNGHAMTPGMAPSRPIPRRHSLFNPPSPALSDRETFVGAAQRQDAVDQLIRAYRVRGHLVARLDPLGIPRPDRPELAMESYGITKADLNLEFSTKSFGGPRTQSLREILRRLQETYCRYIGVQFMHIDDLETRDWLAQRMEATENRLKLPRDAQFRILTRLTDAVIFEEFVRKKFVGATTFSLEGAESLIPLLDLAIEKAASQGVDEIVLAMAHRGRLNVLANVIGKTPQEIFREFNDPNPELHFGSGDVKYHMGFSGDWQSASGRSVHLSLCFNPSHLEFVSPVAVGRTRAKQDRAGDLDRQRGMALLIHGDAAFAGQGIIQETLNLSELPGYRIGGTLHVIVNNQIGFTTTSEEARSTKYASDVAKMLRVPIFHVNGEDPEAVAQTVSLALDFRERYQRDVVIDMYCYRRWGHNEGDEPSFTQPHMYRAIQQRPSVRDGYLKHLLSLGELTAQEADQIAERRREVLENEFKQAKAGDFVPRPDSLAGVWQGYLGGKEPEDDDPETGVAEDRLQQLLHRLTEIPAGFHVHRKLHPSIERRRKMASGEQPLDWSSGEALAFATLATEGHRVRLTGEDSERGTFSQRHAVLHDVEDERTYEVFQHLAGDQAPVEIFNSPLCEAGDIGFQYGYSLDYPEALVAWEAQYGDFVNGGQVLIDQFVASAEDKWRRLSGLVFLLPHGFEGQGPEHSTAQLERWLTLAAEHNLQIVAPTTPAQYFHVLRRQVKRRWRKPLVVLTPKSLLRHARCTSALADFASGRFQRVIGDPPASSHQKVILCGGKLYYELLAYRAEQHRDDVGLVRIEQFYPLPDRPLREALHDYPDGTPVFWVQEEPENLGACFYWRRHYGPMLHDRFPFATITRHESASPATGSAAAHRHEQKELLERAFRATL
jgi:2-oxoglutarate dehydrogenase E1 component